MIETNQLHPSQVIHLFDMERMEEWKKREIFTFKHGEFISYPGKLIDEFFLIIDGNARIFHVHSDGKECVLGILTEGDFVDLSSAFTNEESDAYSIALTNVKAVKVSKAEIQEEVKQTPDLSLALLNHFSKRLQEVVNILEQVAYEKVEERLIHLFKKLMDPYNEEGDWYPLPPFLTHKDIAGMIASTRETVTFLINKLSQTGIVKNDKNRLWISKKV